MVNVNIRDTIAKSKSDILTGLAEVSYQHRTAVLQRDDLDLSLKYHHGLSYAMFDN